MVKSLRSFRWKAIEEFVTAHFQVSEPVEVTSQLKKKPKKKMPETDQKEAKPKKIQPQRKSKQKKAIEEFVTGYARLDAVMPWASHICCGLSRGGETVDSFSET